MRRNHAALAKKPMMKPSLPQYPMATIKRRPPPKKSATYTHSRAEYQKTNGGRAGSRTVKIIGAWSRRAGGPSNSKLRVRILWHASVLRGCGCWARVWGSSQTKATAGFVRGCWYEVGLWGGSCIPSRRKRRWWEVWIRDF